MSVYRAQQKEREIREGIIDLLAYFAVWDLRLDFDTLYSYLQVRAGHLAVKKQLSNMQKRGRVSLVKGGYGLAKYKYPNQAKFSSGQAKLLLKAKRWSRLLGLLPSVKSVAVVNSVAYGNVHSQSDIDLFIVTAPNRIFITKGALMYTLKLLRQLESQDKPAGRFSLGMFVTTKGVKLEKDIMKVNEPDLVYRMITAKPTYGNKVWYSVLKADPYLYEKLPNYVWPKTEIRIHGSGFRALDRVDNIGYRRHLRHTANQAKSHHPDAFIRVRPDIINLHHKGTSAQIADKWQQIRDNY